MLFRLPLFRQDQSIDSDAWGLVSDAQRARLALWSIDTGRDVLSLLQEMRPIVEQVQDGSQECNLVGKLPHCNLYGCLASDGSTHT